MRTNRLIILIASAVLAIGATASAAPDNNGEIKIMYTPEQYDSLLSKWYENTVVESYDNFLNEFIDLDLDEEIAGMNVGNIPDSVYEARLRMIASVIQLPYNDIVRQYIVAYTGRLKNKMQNILGLAQYYFPYIEEELDRQGLPSELKILPIIESALYPKAISRAGAAGLWQFMLRTGKGLGLEVNSFVDERMDPVASTRAACTFLKQLYAIYGDWTLVIAAYNCGPGNVNKALKRVPNAKTYWDIYYQLPKETRGYIPGFIAATYAYTFHKAHQMEPIVPPHPISTDTVTVNRMMHFDQVATTLDVPIEVLRELNPQFKLDIVPASDRKYTLVLPQHAVTAYIEKESEIYGKDSLYLQKYLNPVHFANKTAASSSGASQAVASSTTYKVKKNDVLGSIAKRYGVTTTALMRANNIKNPKALRIGQVLRIPR